MNKPLSPVNEWWIRPDVGRAVECSVCGKRKKPVGRAAPLEMGSALCDDDCDGYRALPAPGDLWPGETREEFGY